MPNQPTITDTKISNNETVCGIAVTLLIIYIRFLRFEFCKMNIFYYFCALKTCFSFSDICFMKRLDILLPASTDMLSIVPLDACSLPADIFDMRSHVNLLCLTGRVTVRIDGRGIEAEERCVVDQVNNPSLRIVGCTEDFRGYMLVFSRAWLNSLFVAKPPFSLEWLRAVGVAGSFRFSESDFSEILTGVAFIADFMSRPVNRLYHRMLEHVVLLYFSTMANCYDNMSLSYPHTNIKERQQNNTLSRVTSDLFCRFLKCVDRNIEKEHSASFYAASLCVSPQYINRIVVRECGFSVKQWLVRELVARIGRRLAETDDAIQQIADDFNFPEVGHLSRFYKFYTGMTPSEYRDKH